MANKADFPNNVSMPSGFDISWGVYGTRLGQALLAATDQGLCGISFVGKGGSPAAVSALLKRWPSARLTKRPKVTAPFARELERRLGNASPRTLPLLLLGSPFQRKVWKTLLRIPPGAVRTYGDVAAAIGRPTAARAVGRAVGDNPIAVLIPCHRVLRSDGTPGGYRWEPWRKQALLELEQARSVDRTASAMVGP